jgi:hypothetical protein
MEANQKMAMKSDWNEPNPWTEEEEEEEEEEDISLGLGAHKRPLPGF